jgi:hypothetical protein
MRAVCNKEIISTFKLYYCVLKNLTIYIGGGGVIAKCGRVCYERI